MHDVHCDICAIYIAWRGEARLSPLHGGFQVSDLLLSIIMLAGLMLSIGGGWMIAKRRNYKQGLLMLIAALVMFGNVAIWLAPTKGG